MKLSDIKTPEDLKRFPREELPSLAQEIREKITHVVSENGGHLAGNLGVVELSIALHRVFNSPKDKIIFDVGHQCYTHKILTGRQYDFDTLRQYGGISGFPKRSESPHDAYETGHASTALSAALGYARARDLQNENHHVVAVVGDGALTGGMCYEALNDAGNNKTRLIVVLNDNQMSIGRNVGALNNYLSHLRTSERYLMIKKGVSLILNKIPLIGNILYKAVQSAKNHLRNLLVKESYFTSLGFKYLGPIDGHNEALIEELLERAKQFKEPVILHIVTTKGAGYAPAEVEPERMHGTPPFSLVDGKCKNSSTSKSYSKALGEELVRLAENNPKIVGISAAMVESTGLELLRQAHPDRVFDVGIAEEHAAALAAGMASGGLRPVLAVYDTFMQRAIDQIIMDIALQKLPVVMALDRSGIGGEDGPTHHGVFGTALFRNIPNLLLLSPRSTEELKQMLAFSFEQEKPVIIRYAKSEGHRQRELPKANFSLGIWEQLKLSNDICIIAYGRMVDEALDASDILSEDGIHAGVINASSIKPIDTSLINKLSIKNIPYIVVEEVQLSGGLGSAIAEYAMQEGLNPPLKVLALPDEFIPHGDRKTLLAELGLDAKSIAECILSLADEFTKDYA